MPEISRREKVLCKRAREMSSSERPLRHPLPIPGLDQSYERLEKTRETKNVIFWSEARL